MSDAALLNIEVKADGVDKAKRSLADLAEQGGKTERSMSGIANSSKSVNSSLDSISGSVKGLIGAYAGLAGVIGFAKISDEYTKFNAQLKIATGSQREFNQALKDVNAIATATQSSLSTVSTLYSRLNNSLKDIGVSQSDVARITETVGLSLKVAGSSAEEAGAAMLQLSQAFGSGVLRGDEFNSLMEASPNLMRALAASIGVPIGKLRDMAAQGQLTADVLTKAFTDDNLLTKLRGQAKEIETISGNLQLLQNSVVNIAGTFSAKLGIVGLFTTAVKDLNSTLQVLAGLNQVDFKLDKMFPSYGTFKDKLKAESLPANNGSKNSNILAQGSLITDAIPRIDIGKIGDADVAFNKLKGTLLDLQKVNPLTDTISKQKEYASNMKTVNDLESVGLLSVQEATRYRAQFNEELTKGTATKKTEIDAVLASIKLTQQENLLLAQGLPLEDAKTIARLKANGATDEMIVKTLKLQQVNKDLIDAQQFEIDFYDNFEKSIVSQGEALDKQIESINANAKALEEENLNYGKLPSVIIETTLARLRDTQAINESRGLVVPEIEAQIQAYQRLKAAQFGKEDLDRNKKAEDDRVTAAKKSADDIAKAYEKASDDINKSITDALLRGFESGKSFAQNFRDTLVNMFKTLVLQPVLSIITKPVAGIIASALGTSPASAAANSLGGSSGSALSSVKGIFDLINNGNASIVGGIESVGASIANGLGGIRDSIGGFIGENASAIADGFAYAGALLQLAQGNYVGAAFTAIGTAIGGPIGGAIGGFIGSVFGDLGGTVDPSGNTTGTFKNGKRTSRSDFSGWGDPVTPEIVGGLATIQDAFASTLTEILTAFNKNTDITLTGAARAGDIFQASISGTVGGRSVGVNGWEGQTTDLSSFATLVMGKGIADAIQNLDLSASFKKLFAGLTDNAVITNMVNATLTLIKSQDNLAKSFGLTVDQSLQVANATGLVGDSLASFMTSLSTAAGSLSQAEILTAARGTLQSVLGQNLPETLKAFDNIIKGIDKSNASGINQVVSLLNIRAGFEQYTNAIDALKDGVKSSLLGVVSSSEKQAMLNADLEKAFNVLGLAVPTSIQDLISLGKTIDFTSTSGLELAAVFPSLVTAFVNTKGAVDDLMNSLRDVNTFTTAVDFNRYKGLAANYGNSFANNYVDGLSSNVVASNSINTPVTTSIVQPSNNTTISTSDPNLLEAIKTLTAQVQALQASSDKTATHSKRAADVLVNVSPNGNALQTEAVT